jgi:hypothetical protein
MREKYVRRWGRVARRLIEGGVHFVTVSNGYYITSGTTTRKCSRTSVTATCRNSIGRSLRCSTICTPAGCSSTLVIATGEFGRTPEINVNAGRDHWPNVFSILLAGAGVPGGQVWGASDADGMFVRDNPVEMQDLVATIYQKVGVDFNKEYLTRIGRPFRLSEGKPLPFLSS